MLLRSLRREATGRSQDVKLIAELVTQGCNDHFLERMASRLSHEPGVVAVTWQVEHHAGL